MPLYQLLGGASRDRLLAYGHASGRDLPELFDSIRQHQGLGYRAIRIQSAVPGLTTIYGVAAQAQSSGKRYDYEPAQRVQHRVGLPDDDQGPAHRLRALGRHPRRRDLADEEGHGLRGAVPDLSLIHISEPTRLGMI